MQNAGFNAAYKVTVPLYIPESPESVESHRALQLHDG